MPEEMDELWKRTWAAIDALDTCVQEKVATEEDEDEANHARVHTIAMTMMSFGLGLESLGELALCLSEIEKISQDCEAEATQSESESEWPENID